MNVIRDNNFIFNKIYPVKLAGDIDFEEDYKHPEYAELSNPETWVHLHSDILKAGRITHLEPELSEEEKQAELDKLNTDDPVNERFKSISEDKRKTE